MEPTTYAYVRGQWGRPALHIPTGTKKAAIIVRCNPRLFKLRSDVGDAACSSTCANKKNLQQVTVASGGAEANGLGTGVCCPVTLAKLQYRIIFAVITLDSVYVYDTQSWHPILALHHLHYSQLTDACWSADGSVLFISSNDGYCSIIEF